MECIKSIFFFLFLTSIAFGQDAGVVLYGTVTTDYEDAIELSSGGIWIRYYTSDNYFFTTEKVGKNGFYKRALPENHKIEVETSYHDYYAEKIVVETDGRDSIRVDLKLIPKPYLYTSEKALTDVRNGKVQLITFDTLEYEWTRKIDLKRNFGFEYVLLSKPKDYDYTRKIDDYNTIVEGYLGLKDPYWQKSFAIVRDSVMNSEADEYAKKNNIDIGKLKFPEKSQLPKMMQQRLSAFDDYEKTLSEEETMSYSLNDILQIITEDKNYKNFRLLRPSISIKYKEVIPQLIMLIVDETEIGLEGYNGIMTCRGIYPQGEVNTCLGIPYTEDDLYTIAGRANHLLKILTSEDFGNVMPNPNKDYLLKLQNRWAYWVQQLQ